MSEVENGRDGIEAAVNSEGWEQLVLTPIAERGRWLRVLRDLGIKVSADFRPPQRLIFETPTSIDDTKARDLRIGAYSYIGPGADIRAATIGRFCSLARQIILGPSEHPTHLTSTHPIAFNPGSWFSRDPYFAAISRRVRVRSGQVMIGDDVWIGAGVLVRTGVTIGTGAIIGAKSLVLQDVEPYAVVAGTPARLIRHRYPEEIRARLLASRWWERDLRGIGRVDFADPIAFCAEVESLPPTAVLSTEKFRLTRTADAEVRIERRLAEIPVGQTAPAGSWSP